MRTDWPHVRPERPAPVANRIGLCPLAQITYSGAFVATVIARYEHPLASSGRQAGSLEPGLALRAGGLAERGCRRIRSGVRLEAPRVSNNAPSPILLSFRAALGAQ